jgi:acyl-coenzyme A synthetase/AMP-(fatty) acid ligase
VHDGLNSCPQEVEEALLQHAAVENAGVVGVHDLLLGENVNAYVTIKDGVLTPSMQELIQFARDRVGHTALSELKFLREMPLSPVSNVDRAGLKRLTAGHHAVNRVRLQVRKMAPSKDVRHPCLASLEHGLA